MTIRHNLKLDVSQEAQDWLTDDFHAINKHVVRVCAAEAKKMQLPIEKLRLTLKQSWEGEFSELVLQVFVNADVPKSLALWDAIGDAIQHWGEKQPAGLKRLLEEQYAIFVEPLVQA